MKLCIFLGGFFKQSFIETYLRSLLLFTKHCYITCGTEGIFKFVKIRIFGEETGFDTYTDDSISSN